VVCVTFLVRVVSDKEGRVVGIAERIVNGQRVRRLAEPDAGPIEDRSMLIEDNFYPPLRESGCRRQSANTASHHQNTSDLAHRLSVRGCGRWVSLRSNHPTRSADGRDGGAQSPPVDYASRRRMLAQTQEGDNPL
jgi:hypothetical protein